MIDFFCEVSEATPADLADVIEAGVAMADAEADELLDYRTATESADLTPQDIYGVVAYRDSWSKPWGYT